jgi:hypothetical protein
MNLYRQRQKAIAYKIGQWGVAFGLPAESVAELAMDAQSMLESGQTAHRILEKIKIVMRDWSWARGLT